MRLLSTHPSLELVFVSGSSTVGEPVAHLYPNLAVTYPDLVFQSNDALPEGLDVVFLALPHGVSQTLVPSLQSSVIIDMGADFRFDDVATYDDWYPSAHTAPGLNGQFTYGLVELFRDQIAGSRAIAVPGCYPTAAVLGIAPLLLGGLVQSSPIIVDAISGVSGAGREAKPTTSFGTVAENLTAYGVTTHRHTPEMEMALSRLVEDDVDLVFTPHLAPINRGILATSYLRPTGSEPTEQLLEAMSVAYKGEPFVAVSERMPSTKATQGSNSIHMSVRRDSRTGWVIVVSAIDNLGKGAAGQALQCANLALGLNETTGLSAAGVYP